ncbi:MULTISPECIES: class I SAM-dependent methyltransferase [unclassified Francisella]|uniref:class I SAM-dependent methyltransferase n=1 Tax=unclassified Francisella TaxID=2610885 RepID=UPI002E340557|nr:MULTISPECIES: class I SAM-dependent methyltransferase [unclassified Francisella]MED7819559.1 class I SAM-dependent methyltransferase [Francisella sp. 19S2-4]MED7830327.1 class I SAM-dependent methyltransferase [Francisella sp. 19S2-10]
MKNELWWNPQAYSVVNQFRIKNALDTLKCLNIKADDLPQNIFDIGTGQGAVIHALALANPSSKFTAIDIDAKMLKHAKKEYCASNINYILENILDISYTTCFDLVISFACLHWIIDLQTAFKNISKSLKEKGKFAALMYPRSGIQFDAIDEVVSKEKWREYFKNFKTPLCKVNQYECEELLRKANFSKINVLKEEVILTTTREDFIKVTKSWIPHLQSLPNALHDDFLNEVADLLPSSPPVDQITFLAEK